MNKELFKEKIEDSLYECKVTKCYNHIKLCSVQHQIIYSFLVKYFKDSNLTYEWLEDEANKILSEKKYNFTNKNKG